LNHQQTVASATRHLTFVLAVVAFAVPSTTSDDAMTATAGRP
jgi:hypothetical protein